MRRKLVFFIVLGFITLVVYALYRFAPGRDPYAEMYEIKYDTPEVIQAVRLFKQNHADFSPPGELGLRDGKVDSTELVYSVYVYYPDSNEIIYFWIRANYDGGTKIAFVSVNKGLTLGNWRDINDELPYSENRAQKRRFEHDVLTPIINLLEIK